MLLFAKGFVPEPIVQHLKMLCLGMSIDDEVLRSDLAQEKVDEENESWNEEEEEDNQEASEEAAESDGSGGYNIHDYQDEEGSDYDEDKLE